MNPIYHKKSEKVEILNTNFIFFYTDTKKQKSKTLLKLGCLFNFLNMF